MRYVHQPLDSLVCGQVCLAILTGEPLSAVLREVPGPFSGKGDLSAFLRRRGWGVSRRFRPLSWEKDPPVPAAICQVSFYDVYHLFSWNRRLRDFGRRDDECRHLVVWAEGRYWEPENRLAKTRHEAEKGIEATGLMTSYLEVRPPRSRAPVRRSR